jgi:hypothetical protein
MEEYHPLPIPTYKDPSVDLANVAHLGLAGLLAKQAQDRMDQELALKQAEDARLAETHELNVRQKKIELDSAKLTQDLHKHEVATAGAVQTGMPTLQDILGSLAPGGTALKPGATAEGSAPLIGPQGKIPQLPGPPAPDQQQATFQPPMTVQGVPGANLPDQTMTPGMFALKALAEQSRQQAIAKRVEEDKAIADGKSVRLRGDITGPNGQVIASAGDAVPTAILQEYMKNNEITFHDAGDKLAATTKGGTRVPDKDIPKGRTPPPQIDWNNVARIAADDAPDGSPGKAALAGTPPSPPPTAPGATTPGPNVSQSAWAPGDIGQGVDVDPKTGALIPPSTTPLGGTTTGAPSGTTPSGQTVIHGAHVYDLNEPTPPNLAPELRPGALNALEPGRNVDTEFLAAQPRGKQILMKSVADYEQSTPEMFRPGREGGNQATVDWNASMKRAFPDYDVTKFAGKQGYVKEVYNTKSGVGRNVLALNTVTLHLGAMNELAKDLATADTPFNKVQAINRFVNFVKTSLGNESVTDFNTALNAVAGEMGNVFKSGTTTDPEIDRWGATLSPNMSSEQIRGVIHTGVGLLEKRLKILTEDYQDKMGHLPRGGSFLHAGTANVLKQLESEYNIGNQKFSASVGGKTYTFPTQDALNRFKQDAGIQ